MVRFSTNVMISVEPLFSRFNCFEAPLTIEERIAWKRRHQYAQPMVPSENSLFFVSEDILPSFINNTAIEKVILNSNVEEHYRILRLLVHQALKILFESRSFSKWSYFYSKKDYMTTIQGRFGLSYNVFNGVKPRVFFEDGYCMIAFDYSSKIFTRFPTNLRSFDAVKYLFLLTLCEECPESSTCENIQHKVSKFLRMDNPRVFMFDLEGKEFDCPVSSVRIESRPRVMKGEYTRILRRTAITTSEEHQFLLEFVNNVSGGNFVLNLGSDIAFSWLELEAQS